jgi:hypothetical protein
MDECVSHLSVNVCARMQRSEDPDVGLDMMEIVQERWMFNR